MRHLDFLNKLVASKTPVQETFVRQRDLFIGGGTRMGTISIGHATLDGRTVNVARKIPHDERTNLKTKFLRDLWFMDGLAAYNLTQFDSQLPLFYALEVGSDGDPVAIITEDYSQRNAHPLLSVKWSELHPMVPNMVQDPKLDTDEVARVGFRVGRNGPIKLGDFDSYANPDLDFCKPYFDKLVWSSK
ncbi:hypothetical protein HYT24_02660 [Candidatus Pacearchaeota archaeon]|nr:hypothetical protein [Candidatus Pacearchaeota archaeon]